MRRAFAILLLLLVTPTAFALDYDRNTVSEREISLAFGLAPVDVDTRAPSPCLADPAKTCEENVALPPVMLVRGTARRHTRNFYLGAEVELGATLPVATFGAHPWIAAGGAIGFETSDNGWDRLRGYGEIGILGVWANTRLAETLTFFSEIGFRYQASAAKRPHLLLHGGLRGMTNFSHFGVLGIIGVGWTFD